MLRGLLEKTLREAWVVILVAALSLGIAAALFTEVLPQFTDGMNEFVLGVPFIRTMISAMMGIDVSEGITTTMLLAIIWTHPIVLTIIWGFAIVFCTRVPSGEIEHGTIDVLLGWPVSRGAVFAAEAIVALCSGLLILACGFTGYWLNSRGIAPELRPPTARVLLTLLNLLAAYFTVGGAAQCIAAACDRRGQAMGLALAFVLTSYLVNFLAQFWPLAERVGWASFVHYYQPAQVLLRGAPPLRDLGVLLVSGALLWGLGWRIWSRRSVRTI